MGLTITGTVGLLLQAKKAGIISKVGPILDELKTVNFRMSDELYQRAMYLADE